jgi:hypothetical protein
MYTSDLALHIAPGLFWFQAGILTKESWRNSLCVCERRDALRAKLAEYDVAATRTKGKHDTEMLPSWNVSRQELRELNVGDVAFYEVARREFERRVRAVEAHVHHRFLHC